MKISHTHKFVYINIPFNGCEFFTHELDKYSQVFGVEDMSSDFYCHAKASYLKKVFDKNNWNWDDYYKFAVVRNPLDRIIVRHYELQSHKPKSEQTEFDERIQYRLNWINHQHQWTHSTGGKFLLDGLIRYEKIQPEFTKLCEKIKIKKVKLKIPNQQKIYSTRDAYTPEVVKKCENHHTTDMRYFGYDKLDDFYWINKKANNAKPILKNKNKQVSFFTIFFDNSQEIELLKLQAASFDFVDESMVSKIILMYNEDSSFLKKDEIIRYYPAKFRSKIKFLKLSHIKELKGVVCLPWHRQQLLKLLISRYIQTSSYIVLDSKNHFIRPVTFDTFFDCNKNAKLFQGYPGDMLPNYIVSLDLFGLLSTSESLEEFGIHESGECHITTTPFTFDTKLARELIEYIHYKTQTEFCEFFLKSDTTEFYLYTAYLYFKKLVNSEMIERVPCVYLMGGGSTEDWNKPASKKNIINNKKIKMLGIHRKNIESVMSQLDKDTMIEYYSGLKVPFLDELEKIYKRNKAL